MTGTTETSTRTIEKKIEIGAPVEAVWKALTDAEELTNRFPLEARVKPGVGGSVWTSWGEKMQWETPIEDWEENRHPRLIWCQPTPPEKMDEAKGTVIPCQVAVDYHLEDHGGRTTLRLVHSGFAGVVHINRPPEDLCATVEGLNHAFLRVRLDLACMSTSHAEINLWLSTYGMDDAHIDAVETRWNAMLDRLLP